MVRALAAYLLVFWLLGLVIHLSGLAYFFAGLAVALLGIDRLMAYSATTLRARRMIGRSFSQRHLLL
jgi:hypothetical protein